MTNILQITGEAGPLSPFHWSGTSLPTHHITTLGLLGDSDAAHSQDFLPTDQTPYDNHFFTFSSLPFIKKFYHKHHTHFITSFHQFRAGMLWEVRIALHPHIFSEYVSDDG